MADDNKINYTAFVAVPLTKLVLLLFMLRVIAWVIVEMRNYAKRPKFELINVPVSNPLGVKDGKCTAFFAVNGKYTFIRPDGTVIVEDDKNK